VIAPELVLFWHGMNCNTNYKLKVMKITKKIEINHKPRVITGIWTKKNHRYGGWCCVIGGTQWVRAQTPIA